MKKNRFFKWKSMYVKFVVIFVGVWWFLNSLTLGVILKIMSNTLMLDFKADFSHVSDGFHKMQFRTMFVFLCVALIGTIIILLVVRGIVKPMKELSKASQAVAKGDFEVEVHTRSEDEVGRLAGDFNKMVKELRGIDTLKKDFVSNVSHEFRTPITSIKGFATLIRDDEIGSEQRFEYSDIIVSESERLMTLSSNLLRLSELESQLMLEAKTMFSLDEQLRKTILVLEPLWSKKSIQFCVELEKVKFFGEEDLLGQVWINLIQNAIKFSTPASNIEISLMQSTDGEVHIKISDYGIGIAKEDMGRIFERFYKGDKSRKGDGNGLGLVIVKKIVELSNGKIICESKLDVGTTFHIIFPNPISQ